MGQDDSNSDYEQLAFYIASDYFLDHPSKDVRLLVACCIADVFRIFAPEAPYNNPEHVKEIFLFLTRQLRGLEDPEAPSFKRYFYLLEVMHDIGMGYTCSRHFFSKPVNDGLVCTTFCPVDWTNNQIGKYFMPSSVKSIMVAIIKKNLPQYLTQSLLDISSINNYTSFLEASGISQVRLIQQNNFTHIHSNLGGINSYWLNLIAMTFVFRT